MCLFSLVYIKWLLFSQRGFNGLQTSGSTNIQFKLEYGFHVYCTVEIRNDIVLFDICLYVISEPHTPLKHTHKISKSVLTMWFIIFIIIMIKKTPDNVKMSMQNNIYMICTNLNYICHVMNWSLSKYWIP